MANPEHLRILKQGVEEWNKWRNENPEVEPDLNEADLTGANLSGVDLSSADLRMACLRDANLSEAVINGACVEGADLSRAKLSMASLINADLSGAHLSGTDLSGAVIGWTTFAGNDLSSVEGLDSVQHYAPSSIDIDTIYRSRGSIPETFLRVAGIPEDFIKRIPNLSFEAFPYPSCFISYSSRDQEFKDRLLADLEKEGVKSYSADRDMKIGDRIRDALDDAIRRHDKLLLILSETSVSSQWVEQEVGTALEEEQKRGKTVLFPVRLDDAVFSVDKGWPNLIKNSRHIGDFTDWKNHDSYQQAFDWLLRDLKAG